MTNDDDQDDDEAAEHPGRYKGRPLPRRLESMAPGNRVILALVGVVIGVLLMFFGLKIISDDVNTPSPAPEQPAGG